MGDRPFRTRREKNRKFRDVRPVEFCGDIDAGQDLEMARRTVGDFLVLGGDERGLVQIPGAGCGGAWRPQRRVSLAQERDQEADIGAIRFGQGHPCTSSVHTRFVAAG